MAVLLISFDKTPEEMQPDSLFLSFQHIPQSPVYKAVILKVGPRSESTAEAITFAKC